MREDASCKKQAHRFRTVGMLCTAKSGSEESLPTVALCTHDRRPVVPAAQKLGHADDAGGDPVGDEAFVRLQTEMNLAPRPHENHLGRSVAVGKDVRAMRAS